MAKYSHRLLVQVTDLAREVLKKMEPKERPPSLHKVAARTGRTLPPPYARVLIKELDENEKMRERVGDDFEGEADSDDIYEVAAYLFLFRPEGWEDELSILEQKVILESASTDLDKSGQKISNLEREVRTYQSRYKRSRQTLETYQSQQKSRIEKAREAAYKDREKNRKEIKRLKKTNQDLAEQVAEKEQELSETKRQLETTRQELQRERRVEHAVPQPSDPNLWATRTPLEAAEFLDEMVQAFRPPATFDAKDWRRSVEDSPTLPSLPPGVRPDSKASIEWLQKRTEKYALLVDGYNLIFYMHTDAPKDLSKARHRLERQMDGFNQTAASRPRVVIVYDSQEMGVGSLYKSSPWVEVFFTSGKKIADEKILELAEQMGNRAVVVSNDREVWEGATKLGALSLFSTAMSEWIQDH